MAASHPARSSSRPTGPGLVLLLLILVGALSGGQPEPVASPDPAGQPAGQLANQASSANPAADNAGTNDPAPGPERNPGSEPETAFDPVGPAWPDATILDQRIQPAGPDNIRRLTTLLQPADLPYPVRVEEKRRINPETGEETPAGTREIVANRILVARTPGADPVAFEQLIRGLGGRLTERVGPEAPAPGQPDTWLVTFPGEPDLDTVPRALETLAATDDLIAFAEADGIVRAQVVPNDTGFADQWWLNNTGQGGGTVDADIDAPEAWDLRRSADGIVVAVVDSGMRTSHNDLRDNLWQNPSESADGIDNDGNGIVDDVNGFNAISGSGDPFDSDGHGTHVGGIIGASGNNDTGISGVAWSVDLMPLKFIGNGTGSNADSIRAVNYARSEGADIINASYGGPSFSISSRNAIEAAGSTGILFVAAAGNETTNNDNVPSYPASYDLPNLVAVASTTPGDNLSGFSNYGEQTVTLGAPGSGILSTYNASDSSYRELSGTSMAAPVVSGILALLKAEYPSETTGLIDRLLAGGDAIDALAGRTASGVRANLAGALEIGANVNIPRITTPLDDREVTPGAAVNFSVTASGTEPFQYAWTRDGVTVSGEDQATLALPDVTEADAGTYRVTVSNAFGTASSSAVLSVRAPSSELAEATDRINLDWTTDEPGGWTRDTTTTFDGTDSAASGSIGNNETSAMETTVEGPVRVRFQWKVSSEAFFDYLVFSVGDDVINRISGEVDWTGVTHDLPAGTHTLRWTYEKDTSLSRGSDRGWIDQVLLEGEGTAPVITRQPESITLAPGNDVTFRVAATGSAPLAYQWTRDGTPLAGGTLATYTVVDADSGDAGSYRVTVSNAAGSTESLTARLTVDGSQPPRIIDQPAAGTFATGSTATLTVRAGGSAPFTYQWFKDGDALTGQTEATLVINDVADADAGAYSLRVANNNGSVDSEAAILEVVDAVIAPVITKQPDPLVVDAGENATFSVEVSGVQPITYQWQRDGVDLAGADAASLALTGVSETDAGAYRVIVANPIGQTTSDSADLQVRVRNDALGAALDDPALVWDTSGDAGWTSQTRVTEDGVDAAQSGTIGNSEQSTLTSTVIGPGELSFFWRVSSESGFDYLQFYFDDVLIDEISGERDWLRETLSIGEGVHTLRWVYDKDFSLARGDDAGWVDRVRYEPEDGLQIRILEEPVGVSVRTGQTADLSVRAIGNGALSYQWYRNGRALSGARSPTLRISGATVADSGRYHVVITSATGSVASRSVRLAVFDEDASIGAGFRDGGSLDWETFPVGSWFRQSEVFLSPPEALQSGPVEDGGVAGVDVGVEGPGILAFNWKVSSEAFYDGLGFSVGTDVRAVFSGEQDWRQEVADVPDGPQLLSWLYVKDEGVSEGMDAGWLDNVRWFPQREGPALIREPDPRQVLAGDPLRIPVVARSNSGGLSYQWYQGASGDTSRPVPGQTDAGLDIPSINGDNRYWVRVTDNQGSADSRDVRISVLPADPGDLFPGATKLGADRYRVAWLGDVFTAELPWIHTETHGWWRVLTRGGGYWFYDPSLGWLFTRADRYPYLFSESYQGWLYYEPGTTGPRFFYLFSAGDWIAVE
ncbi:MAG: immunoglobulin domain-containing protein [Opitutales bacterium]